MLAMPVLRRHVVILAAHSSAENREEIARRLVDEATIGVALLVAMSDEDLRCRSNVGVRECKRLPQFRLIERGSAQVLIFGRVATPLAESKFSNSVFREPRCSRGECLVSIPPSGLSDRIRLQFIADGDVALTALLNELVEIAVPNY